MTHCWPGAGTEWLTVNLSSRCTAEGNRICPAVHAGFPVCPCVLLLQPAHLNVLQGSGRLSMTSGLKVKWDKEGLGPTMQMQKQVRNLGLKQEKGLKGFASQASPTAGTTMRPTPGAPLPSGAMQPGCSGPGAHGKRPQKAAGVAAPKRGPGRPPKHAVQKQEPPEKEQEQDPMMTEMPDPGERGWVVFQVRVRRFWGHGQPLLLCRPPPPFAPPPFPRSSAPNRTVLRLNATVRCPIERKARVIETIPRRGLCTCPNSYEPARGPSKKGCALRRASAVPWLCALQNCGPPHPPLS